MIINRSLPTKYDLNNELKLVRSILSDNSSDDVNNALVLFEADLSQSDSYVSLAKYLALALASSN